MKAQTRQYISDLFEIGGIANLATIRMFIVTGDKRLTISPRYSSDVLGANFTLLEDAVQGAGGTAIVATRLNREHGDTADFTLTKDATETAPGTQIFGGTTIGLQSRIPWFQEPMVLKPNATYQITILNVSGGAANASMEVLFTQDA